jgi:dipeptidyl aminopeptidase/acylaminoacyl peptidase
MRLPRAALAACALACATTQAKPEPAAPAAEAQPQKRAADLQPYSGHGAASVPKEVLDHFAPKPLPDALSRTIQAMLDVRAPSSGILSPDGSALYFRWRVTGTDQIWRLEGPLRFPIQLTGGQDRTSAPDIAPDGTALILERDRKGEENPGLYLQDPQGGPLQLIQHKPGIQTAFQFVSDDSRYVYFRSNDKKPDAYALYRYDRKEKRIEDVFAQEGLWYIADHKPGKLLLGNEVGSNMIEVFEWDENAKQLRPLFGQGEREEYDPGYGPGEEILVSTPHFGEFRRLYTFRKGRFTPVTAELNYDVSGWSIDRLRRQRILYTVNEGGYTRAHAMDARTHKDLALPALPAADHVNFGYTTPDGRFSVLAVDTGTEPLQSYVLDWNSGKLTRWHTGSAPEVDLGSFVRARLESYPARDGTQIPVFVREPKNCPAPCPVVIQFHGGPEAQTQPGFSVSAQMLVDAGFIVAQPNVRGSDGYGKTWIHADDGPKRLQIITDIEDAAIWARKRFGGGKVGIYGGSYGGYSSIIGMTMFAGAYDAGVEIVGISNLVTFLMNTAPYRRALRVSEYGDPEKDRDALIKLSPITHIDKVKGPLLLIQGASDPRVPVGEALQIHDALQARNLPVELVIFSDEGHGAQTRSNQVYQIGYSLRFFEKYLQGKQME